MRFTSALKITGPIVLVGHDIGGAVAQHLLAHDQLAISRLALVNSVSYDSWPAPHVARLLDLDRASTPAADDFLTARRRAATTDLAGAATQHRIDEYVAPWKDPRIRRSWVAMARAAASHYTLDLVPALQQTTTAKLLIWGEDDAFEKVEYAEKFALEIPETRLVRIPNARHLPTENDPDKVAHNLSQFLAT